MTQVLIPVKALPNCMRHGIRMMWEVCQVMIMAVNATITLWQIRMSPMMEVWNHLQLQVWEVLWKSCSFLALNIFIYDVNYDYIWFRLWLFLTWIMIIFAVLYEYFMYIFRLIIQGLVFQRGKNIPKLGKKWRGLRCTRVVVFYLRKIWVAIIHHFCQAMRRRLKGGGGALILIMRERLMKKSFEIMMNKLMIKRVGRYGSKIRFLLELEEGQKNKIRLMWKKSWIGLVREYMTFWNIWSKIVDFSWIIFANYLTWLAHVISICTFTNLN